MRAELLLRPDGLRGCGGAGRGCGGRAGTFEAGVGWSQAGWGVLWGSSPETVRESPWARGATVPVLPRVPTAGEGGSWCWGKGSPHTPRPTRSCPREELRLCGGPGQGTESHGLGRKGL